jgi:excinuclease ABC subunit C
MGRPEVSTSDRETTALLRELELIRRFRPRFNVRGRPGRGRRAYLALGGGPGPSAYLTDKGSHRDRLLIGPLWPGRELRRMVRAVNDCFLPFFSRLRLHEHASRV